MKKSLFLVMVMLSGEALADTISNSSVEYNLRNAGQSFMECAAYYDVVSGCVSNSDNQEKLSEEYKNIANKAASFALTILSSTNMNEKAIAANYELQKKDLLNKIEQRCENISILMNDYLEQCENKMKNPSKYMSEKIN